MLTYTAYRKEQKREKETFEILQSVRDPVILCTLSLYNHIKSLYSVRAALFIRS